MRIRRRRLRSALVLVGCLVGDVPFVGATGDPVSTAVSSGAAALAPGVLRGAGDATRLAAALLLLAVGSALHLWSKGCLEQNQRLVTAGPYRFTRNPFYLANGLVDLGLGVLIGRIWVTLPYLVIWWLAYRDTIAREEARLRALFPAEVERYFAAVPRLIPNGRALPRGEAVGRFAFDNPALSQGGEYARLLGFQVAAAAIAASAWLRETGLAALADEHSVGLALVLLVPVAWVVKLALAELFRRPGTVLLPLEGRPRARLAVTILLVVVVLLLGAGAGPRVWLADAPLLWVLLAGLEASVRAADRRAPRSEAVGERRSVETARVPWRLRRPVALGTMMTIVVVAVLDLAY